MVCFIDGKPRKGEYRKFNIKTVDGIDDFASTKEVVFRKYKRALDESTTLPDLILIDGGKGSYLLLSALDALGLDYIPIIGLAKKLEEVFKPGLSEARIYQRLLQDYFYFARLEMKFIGLQLAFIVANAISMISQF